MGAGLLLTRVTAVVPHAVVSLVFILDSLDALLGCA